MSDQHFFATHALGYVKADTREEAIKRLLLENTDPAVVRNHLKGGCLMTIYTCRVATDIDATYRIEWFMPVGVDADQGENYLITHLTKTKHAVMRDPNDKITTLKRKLEALQSHATDLENDNAAADS